MEGSAKKMKRKTTDKGENICKSRVWQRTSIKNMHRTLKTPQHKTIQLENEMHWNFTEGDTQMENECEMNLSEQLKWKVVTSNAGENAEKLDKSSMVSGTIKWYSHWGKWLGNYIY